MPLHGGGAGGYHPVSVGERYKEGRYTVLQKLGWGHFSTVWLVSDALTGGQAALKVRVIRLYPKTLIRPKTQCLQGLGPFIQRLKCGS